MSDDIDRANDLADLHLAASLDKAMQVTGNEMLTGWCRNDCGESTQGAFCSASCRRDYDLRQRNKR